MLLFFVMKNYCFLLVSILFIVSCKSRNTGEGVESGDQAVLYISDSLSDRLSFSLSDWLTYYDIDVSNFQIKDTSKLEVQSLKNEAAVYFRKFADSDTLYLPNVRDYSPNGRYHLNLLEATNVCRGEDGKWYFSGIDDYQQIFLCDRQDSSLMVVSLKKLYNFIDAAFWIDDVDFVLAGVDRQEYNTKYFIELYNLSNEIMVTYDLPDSTISGLDKCYMVDVNMKSRGIAIK